MTITWNTKRLLAIAHRGDTKSGIENTMPAIVSALKLGADGVEVDLRLTRDGRVILFHDDDLRRLADRPERIEDLPYSEVSRLSLSGSSIPALEELLEAAGSRALMNLELKSGGRMAGELERATVKVLRRFSLKENILFSSFQPWTLWHLKRLAPDIPRGVLFENRPWAHRLLFPCTRPWSLNAPLAFVGKDLADACHRRSLRLLVWTVNREDDMKSCIQNGVDGIITDEPARLLKLIGRTNQAPSNTHE